ncbi:MAG: hypothetical protein LBR33_11045 [Propionibacteriaceae bacterium]|jgi:hypothetical protein|nr:hypothetical protein [Propionibacteriaceae bacterium]
MAGPLSLVRAAFGDSSCRSVADLERVTGLPRDVLDAALDHLVFTGVLKSEALASGCPEGACGSCALGHSCAARRPGDVRARSLALVHA